jgi:transposase InsO family protein
MYQELNDYIKTCDICQKSKTDRKRHPVPLTPLPVGETFQRIHIDILCSLPKTKEGYQYVLLIVDSFSKWTEAFPLKTQEATEIADILFREIICRYGAPDTIVSDRGRNFMSKLVSALCELFSITRHHTSSYHPQTNATVERTNSTLAQILRTYIDKDQKDWVNLLPCAMMALRSKPCTESTGFSPYQMLFGKEMQLPVDTSLIPKPNLNQTAQEYMRQLISRLKLTEQVAKANQETQQAKAKARHDLKSKSPTFAVGDEVLLKNDKVETGLSSKLTHKWIGPFQIIEVGPSFTYKIKNLKDNKPHKSLINAARLKL